MDEHIKGINGELSILCSQIGFDPGTLAFDQSKGMKTATEVVSENSKTYGTVKAHENNIRDSLIDMVHAIFDLAIRYGLTWDGVPVERLLSGGYDVSVTFDDSIIQDKEAELNQGVLLVNSGLLSKYTFLTDKKYGQGMTPEEAEAELKRIAQEKSADVRTVDIFAAGRGVEI